MRNLCCADQQTYSVIQRITLAIKHFCVMYMYSNIQSVTSAVKHFCVMYILFRHTLSNINNKGYFFLYILYRFNQTARLKWCCLTLQVVFTSPYEHHSNILPWREIHAEVSFVWTFSPRKYVGLQENSCMWVLCGHFLPEKNPPVGHPGCRN